MMKNFIFISWQTTVWFSKYYYIFKCLDEFNENIYMFYLNILNNNMKWKQSHSHWIIANSIYVFLFKALTATIIIGTPHCEVTKYWHLSRIGRKMGWICWVKFLPREGYLESPAFHLPLEWNKRWTLFRQTADLHKRGNISVKQSQGLDWKDWNREPRSTDRYYHL